MFKGIQDIMHKKPGTKTSEVDTSLIKLLSARALLEDEKRQELIDKLPPFLCISKESYDTLVTAFIKRFAEFVQELPETRGGYFSMRGGIIEHSLNRSTIALSLIRSYFLPENDNHATLTQPQTLWAYAIFTAGMLMGIGKLVSDLSIDLFDATGKYLKKWSPWDGSMVSMATYYKYDFETPYPEIFRNRITILLARQILPEAGYRWLTSDKEIFSVWLALLDDDDRGGHTLGPVLWLADALSIQQYLDLALTDRDPKSFLERGKFAGAFTQMQDRDLTGKMTSTALGATFLNWLRESIASGSIKIGGENYVHYVPEGVILNPGIFEVFVRENPQFKNWQAVQTAFTGLGLHRHYGGQMNEIFQRYIKIHNQEPMTGILINNAELILPKEMIQNNKSQNYARVSGMESVKKQYISTTGKLVTAAPEALTPTHNPLPNAPKTKG